LDLPEADFNYEEFVAQEFGGASKPGGLRLIWLVAGIVLLIAFALLCFFELR
jgi:hypothetical protein